MDRSTRNLLIALAVVAGVILLFSALAGSMMVPAMAGGVFGSGAMPGHAWMWGLGMGFGGLAMVLFWGVLILGLVLLARSAGLAAGAGRPQSSEKTPLDVLRHRYAAVELSREQFEQMRKDIES